MREENPFQGSTPEASLKPIEKHTERDSINFGTEVVTEITLIIRRF